MLWSYDGEGGQWVQSVLYTDQMVVAAAQKQAGWVLC